MRYSRALPQSHLNMALSPSSTFLNRFLRFLRSTYSVLNFTSKVCLNSPSRYPYNPVPSSSLRYTFRPFLLVASLLGAFSPLTTIGIAISALNPHMLSTLRRSLLANFQLLQYFLGGGGGKRRGTYENAFRTFLTVDLVFLQYQDGACRVFAGRLNFLRVILASSHNPCAAFTSHSLAEISSSGTKL